MSYHCKTALHPRKCKLWWPAWVLLWIRYFVLQCPVYSKCQTDHNKSEKSISIQWNRTYFQKSMKTSSQRNSLCSRKGAIYGDLPGYSSPLGICLFDNRYIANAKLITKIRKIDSNSIESHIFVEICGHVLTTPLTLPPRNCGLW